MTFDAIATRLDSPAQGYTQSFYLGDIDVRGSDIVYDEEANLITSVAYDNFVPEVVTQTEERVVDTYQLGWNTQFDATDNLTLNTDLYWSKSERDAGGKDNFVVAGIKGDQDNGSGNFGRFTLNEHGLPDIDVILDSSADGRTFAEANNEDYGVHYIEYGGTDILDEVLGASFDGEFLFDGGVVESLDFGIQYTDRQKDRIKIDNETSLCLYCNYPFTFASAGANVVRPFPVDNFFDGVSGDFPRSFAVFDIPAYIDALKAVDGTGENPLNGMPYDSSQLDVKPNAVQSYKVQEETLAAYIQANLRGENWFGNFGLRVVTTDLSSAGAVRDIVSVAEYGDGEAAISDMSVTYSDPRAMSASNDYTKVLPSVNFGYELTDDLLLRVSAAQVIARPSLDQLSFIVDDAGPRDGYFYIGHQGSPYLDPIEANQADIGLEWYYSDESALTGVVFWKDIDGFITTQLETDVPAESIVTGEFDPELIPDGFITETVLNGDKAKVLGLELGLQHFFNNGFGVVANYTYTDTESIVGGEDVGDLEGIARDSYSLSVIYEQDKLSAQISADYSGEIIVANETILGGPGVPAKSESMTWLTASIHYDLTDSVGVYLEGTNLLNENYKAYAGRKDVPMSYEVYGRSYYMGVNYSF
jgi:TonB-dependent receptor